VHNWGIIGLGTIGSALVGGLNSVGNCPYIYDKNFDKRVEAEKRFDCDFAATAADVLTSCSVVFLCIRTSQINGFLSQHSGTHARVIVLFQSGFSLSNLPISDERKTGFLRAITNINVLSGDGYTVLLRSANPAYPEVREVFLAMGEVLEVDTEEKLELYSLPPGCGPAPVLAFYESLKAEAVRMGLEEELAGDVSANVIIGSIKAMRTRQLETKELAARVGTKGGVVEQAIQEMQERQGFSRELSQYFNRIRRAQSS
jgi:pyrroline-5-carboxylate reductase